MPLSPSLMTDINLPLDQATFNSSQSDGRILSTKRKLDDAFQSLDDAVNSVPREDQPPPLKRTNTIRSLYSTLAKYGIRSGAKPSSAPAPLSVTKSTPHLSAILARAATKTKNTFSFKFQPQAPTPGQTLSATAEYRPSSLPSFLSRLATYKLSTYANKPQSIDAVAASKCGWVNDGKDRLVCRLCNASWVVAGREGMSRDAANSLIEKQRASLVDSHKNGCPWKTRQCDDSIYCVPLLSPTALIKDVKIKAIAMDAVMKDIVIKHPLTASQLNSLRTSVSSFTTGNFSAPIETEPDASSSIFDSGEPSETAVLAALFGWTLVPQAPPEHLRRASTTSRFNSPVPGTPSLSRASSVSLPRTPSRTSTRTPAMAARISPETSVRVQPTPPATKQENSMLHCELCQRRLGLWGFATQNPVPGPSLTSEPIEPTSTNANPQNGTNVAEPVSSPIPAGRAVKPLPRRSFDLLKEHRSYCPYVVRSTVVPSLPVQQTQSPATPARGSTSTVGHASTPSVSGPPGALEGWKAALAVISRYGMARKQRIEYNLFAPKDSAPTQDEGEDKMEVDNVKAMVAGVKSRGGKDLLKYVKGLLG
ncbi:hypothetical protein D9619_004476 [Psilocybe cf. subviscida]|uniref:C3HC-type domain-containing protein n=1 Tax=Psilocybe cf. subviscida TaxID=2480587 RepID=A0A8H5BNQ2_9AGAR|nr:hypothetical protein D9619_004476 [Psilocybe cf. subviscida]